MVENPLEERVTDGATHTDVSSGMPDSLSYPRYALIIFLLCHACVGLDRQVFSILIQPIKADFHLNDSELGFISGVSFALFFAVVGVPIGRLADRTNRRNLIAVMLVVFSAMTVFCGTVTNFWQLALARMGVGLGEGGVAPPTQSMVADMFPVKKRSTAMSYYASGSYIGSGVGFLVAGWISQWYGWRLALVVVGMPGLILAVVVRFTLREPIRGTSDGFGQAARKVPAGTLLEAARIMWSQRAFRHIVLAGGLSALGSNAFTAWVPAYLGRSFGMSLGHVGTSLALITGVAGGVGILMSGRIVDHFGRNDIRRGVWILTFVSILRFPVSVLVVLAQGPAAALVFYVLATLCSSFHGAPGAAYVQSLAPVRIRATASALMFLVYAILGVGAGPQIVGLLSDLFSAHFGTESVRYALLTITIIYLWAAAHFYWSARTLEADIARARAFA